MNRISIDEEGLLMRERDLPRELGILDLIASYEPSIDEEESFVNPKKRHKNSLKLPGVYLIADIHPKYPPCTEEITRKVLINWAQNIRHDDTVYVLGKQGFTERKGLENILPQFNGITYFVPDEVSSSYPLNKDFLLVHDIEDIPDDWHGWTIHGCPGKKLCKKYPFIEGEMKTINVSASLVGYSPVNFDYLLSLNLDTIRRMETSRSNPQRY